MIADYRQNAVSVFYGFKSLTLSKIEQIAKDKADGIDINLAYSMVMEVNYNPLAANHLLAKVSNFV
ncbi:unnamed protein product [Absidia cylindrospora]